MYKLIQEFPRWEINKEGHIRNVKTKVTKFTFLHKSGYEHVHFKKNGKQITRKVHRLVAQNFLPEPEENLVKECSKVHPYVVCVNHINGNKSDNRVDNLEWCSMKQNSEHAIKNNLLPDAKGENNGRSVLTEDIVHRICQDFEKGMQPSEAVKKYKISKQQATKIRAGFAWKHVWCLYNITVKRRTKKFNDQS